MKNAFQNNAYKKLRYMDWMITKSKGSTVTLREQNRAKRWWKKKKLKLTKKPNFLNKLSLSLIRVILLMPSAKTKSTITKKWTTSKHYWLPGDGCWWAIQWTSYGWFPSQSRSFQFRPSFPFEVSTPHSQQT